MKKRFLIVVAVLMCVALLVSCSAQQPTASSAAPASSEAAATSAAPASSAAAASADTSAAPSVKSFKVGYVCNFMSHEWYQNVCAGAKTRAAELGISLEIADANLDSNQQISFAENFIAKKVDVLVMTPVDAKTLGPIVKKATDAGIKVITESNPVGGELTCVGADNKGAGKQAGLWYGNYAKQNNLTLNFLIVGYPNFADCAARVAGFKEGLQESGANYKIAQEVDSQGSKEKALTVSTDAVTAHPEINAIFGINDDSTQGGIAGFKSAGGDVSKLTAVGFGLEGKVGREALLTKTPIIAELAMFPGYVGASIIDASVSAMNGEKLPERFLTPTTMVTPDTYKDFYTQNGDQWNLNFDAVRALNK